MTAGLEPLGTTPTAHLFQPLHDELMSLLRGLAADDWQRPTLARGWLVRDIAAHLLDGDLRRLSFHRDRHPVPQPDHPPAGFPDLVRLLNQLNADWIRASHRLSPRVLMDLMDAAGPQVATFVATLDPNGPAAFPVAWAGESASLNWFDIGRDYTERWHHQAQIRDAVGAVPLDGPEWLQPVIELSLRAFPRALTGLSAPPQAALVLRITGSAGGTWSIVRTADTWSVCRGEAAAPWARAECDADTAWRWFFNALPGNEVKRRVRAEGDPLVIARLHTVRAVMV